MNRRSFINKGICLIVLGGISFIGFASQPHGKNKKYKIIAQRCDGCGHCFKACKEKALKPEGKIAVIDQSKCKGCGDCQRFCRRMAIVPVESK